MIDRPHNEILYRCEKELKKDHYILLYNDFQNILLSEKEHMHNTMYSMLTGISVSQICICTSIHIYL